MNTFGMMTIMCLYWMSTLAQLPTTNQLDVSDVESQLQSDLDRVHTRSKRTLFLKKKIIGAGLVGFGLGVAKGFKVGFQHSPEVQHVYLAAPPPPPSPVRYVEYIEKPIYIEKYVERPSIAKQEHAGYDGAWSPPREPSPVYGY